MAWRGERRIARKERIRRRRKKGAARAYNVVPGPAQNQKTKIDKKKKSCCALLLDGVRKVIFASG